MYIKNIMVSQQNTNNIFIIHALLICLSMEPTANYYSYILILDDKIKLNFIEENTQL